MNFKDPSEESLPSQYSPGLINPFATIGKKEYGVNSPSFKLGSLLGPISSPVPAQRVELTFAPFSERFDRSIDTIQSPPAGGGGGGGGSSGPYPFDVEFTAGSDGSHKTATTRPGTINGIIPSNILTTADLSVSSAYYLVLNATVADGEITACTISFDSSPPSSMPVTLGEPPTSFSYVLGMIIGDGSLCVWFRTIGSGSLTSTGSEVYRVPKAFPSPGTIPYDIYWTWVLTNA